MAFNIYEWRRKQIALLEDENLNESKTKVKDIKFSSGDLYPTSISMGSSKKIKSEDEFKAWQTDFIKKYGNIELEKGAAGWKASPEHEANKQAQTDFDKNAKRK